MQLQSRSTTLYTATPFDLSLCKFENLYTSPAFPRPSKNRPPDSLETSNRVYLSRVREDFTRLVEHGRKIRGVLTLIEAIETRATNNEKFVIKGY